ncbi:GST-36 protein [Aphelenchoides avenae]|nr:GST-36 protein [Aphelenchus avenae]
MGEKYKLYYTTLRGRAEPIRMILHYAKQTFEEVQFPLGVQGAMDSMPFKMVPVLEVTKENDEVLTLAQTTAILRYVGKKFGLFADSLDDQAICDMYAEFIQDCIMMSYRILWTLVGREPVEKTEEHRQATYLPMVKMFGERVEKQMEKAGTGYLAGNKLTWADVMIACFVDMFSMPDKEAFSAYPRIEKHRRMVFDVPAIKEYIATRPDYRY